jgi:hypothetical protein
MLSIRRLDEDIGAKVRASFLASDLCSLRATYGARRVWHDLLAAARFDLSSSQFLPLPQAFLLVFDQRRQKITDNPP